MFRPLKQMRAQNGFTLIELLVVVAIIGIIAAIAVPQYSDYVTRGKIAEAISNLTEMRAKLEQHFQDNRTYVGACAAGTVAPLPTGRYFTYTCPTLGATTFTVTATGVATQALGGFAYTIDQSNVKTTTMSTPSTWTGSTSCWVTTKSGSC